MPEADIRLERVTKRFGDFTAVDDLSLEIPRGRVLLAARAVRLRQDDDAAHDRRLRGGHLRLDLPRRPGRHGPAAVQARDEHRLPELRALPAPQRLREHRLRPAPPQDAGQRDQAPGRVHARPRRAARLRAAQAEPAVGRPAAARRAGARARQQPAGAPARRAARRPGPQAAQADAGGAEADPERGRHHLHLRDARPGGGDDDVRPHRRHARRPDRAARRAGGALRAPADRLRGRASWASATCSTRRSPVAATRSSSSACRTARWSAPRGQRRTARPRCGWASGPRSCASLAIGDDAPPRRTATRTPSRARSSTRSYIGVSTQYLVETADGHRLTVYAQNLETSGAGEVLADGQRVRLTWKPQHTFVIDPAPDRCPRSTRSWRRPRPMRDETRSSVPSPRAFRPRRRHRRGGRSCATRPRRRRRRVGARRSPAHSRRVRHPARHRPPGASAAEPGAAPRRRRRAARLRELAALHRHRRGDGRLPDARRLRGGRRASTSPTPRRSTTTRSSSARSSPTWRPATPPATTSSSMTDWMIAKHGRARLPRAARRQRDVPNFDGNARDLYKDPWYDPGNQYSVAWQSGITGIGYNPDADRTRDHQLRRPARPRVRGQRRHVQRDARHDVA